LKVYIYALKHPETQEIRYVGLTRHPARRLRNEVSCPHTKHLKNWIYSITSKGLKPQMEILEETEEGPACDSERRWIKELRARGCRLINFTQGGENGFLFTEEAKLRLKGRGKGKKRGPLSAEHRKHISESLKGRECSPGNGKYLAALNRKRAGIPLPDSTKSKLRTIAKNNLKGEWFDRFVQGNRDRPRLSKISEEQKSEIKFFLSDGYSLRVLAKHFGLSVGTISDARRNKIWKNISPASCVPANRPAFKKKPVSRNGQGQWEIAA
jgi:hypothetical protein